MGHAMHQTNNTHVIATQRLMSPDELKAEIPISERAADFVYAARERIRAVIHGRDPRLLVIAGPCSIEGRDQLLQIAREVKAQGACMLRGGAYKPRTSPH